MISLIVATHGNFSEEIIKSGEMIFGQQENIKAITFLPGEDPQDLESKLKTTIDGFNRDDSILILVDLFGGSPFNAASKIATTNENMDIVTGVSLPMLLAAFANRETADLDSFISAIKDEAVNGIKSLKETLKDVEEDDL